MTIFFANQTPKMKFQFLHFW